MLNRDPLDLSTLKEFTTALVTGFDPEQDPRLDDDDNSSMPYLFNMVNQHLDMLCAYRYAQDTILPAMRAQGIANITEKQLISYLKATHERIAAYLAVTYDTSAGEFATENIVRWQFGIDTKEILMHYVGGGLDGAKTKEYLMNRGVNAELADSMMAIATKCAKKARKMRTNKSIVVPGISYTDPAWVPRATVGIIEHDYHHQLFSKRESAAIEKFVKFCMPHAEYPAAMHAYATKLLNAWQKCDPKDIDQICQLLFQAFYELTEIHPWFNGNGRTATCLINIILRYFNLPSILLREPLERNDPTSLYSRMVASLVGENPDPSLFIELIKYRLEQNKQHGPYNNPELNESIVLRHQLAIIRDDMAELTSEEEELDVLLALNNKHFGANATSTDIEGFRSVVLEYQKTLDATKAKQTTTKDVLRFNPTAKDFTPAEKSEFAETLGRLTGNSGWKVFQTNGALFAFYDVADEVAATQVVDQLNATGACEAKAQFVAARNKHSVSVINANIHKLKSQLPQMAASATASSSP